MPILVLSSADIPAPVVTPSPVEMLVKVTESEFSGFLRILKSSRDAPPAGSDFGSFAFATEGCIDSQRVTLQKEQATELLKEFLDHSQGAEVKQSFQGILRRLGAGVR